MAGDAKRKETIRKRKERQQQQVLEGLLKKPIITQVLLEAGVSTSTYYRWRDEDEDFRKKTEKAYQSGAMRMNDIAESQLFKKVCEGDRISINYWLNHRHPSFANRPVMFEDQHDTYKKGMKSAWYMTEQLINGLFKKNKE